MSDEWDEIERDAKASPPPQANFKGDNIYAYRRYDPSEKFMHLILAGAGFLFVCFIFVAVLDFVFGMRIFFK